MVRRLVQSCLCKRAAALGVLAAILVLFAVTPSCSTRSQVQALLICGRYSLWHDLKTHETFICTAGNQVVEPDYDRGSPGMGLVVLQVCVAKPFIGGYVGGLETSRVKYYFIIDTTTEKSTHFATEQEFMNRWTALAGGAAPVFMTGDECVARFSAP